MSTPTPPSATGVRSRIRGTRRRSSSVAATTATASNTVQAPSMNDAGSASPACGPNGIPAVRLSTQTQMVPSWRTRPASTARRFRVVSRATDQATSSHARTPKNAPAAFHSSQCSGITAKWMPAAPNDAAAAR